MSSQEDDIQPFKGAREAHPHGGVQPLGDLSLAPKPGV